MYRADDKDSNTDIYVPIIFRKSNLCSCSPVPYVTFSYISPFTVITVSPYRLAALLYRTIETDAQRGTFQPFDF